MFSSTAVVGDITARSVDCGSKFRVTYNAPTSGYSGYGTTSYRTATWTGGSSPTWLHPVASLHTSGRAMGALLVSEPIPNSNQSTAFFGMFEQNSSPRELFVAREAYTTPSCSN